MARSIRSSQSGKRTLPWLNMDVALSTTSKMSTASGNAPSTRTAAELDDHREDNLARMETQPRGDIEFQIRVVHPMQSPQHRHGMKDHMLTVDHQIEQEHCDGDRDPSGQPDNVEQAPTFGLRKESHPDSSKWEQQAHDQRVQHHKSEVVRPAEAGA